MGFGGGFCLLMFKRGIWACRYEVNKAGKIEKEAIWRRKGDCLSIGDAFAHGSDAYRD